jgi:glycosyltransferase involved in cell wall biosynthesis
MRVLNVNALLDAATGGGCAERTFQLSRAFAAESMTTTVLTLDVGLTDARRAALKDIELITLPSVNRRFLVPRFRFSDFVAAARRADVVHIMGHWTPINAIANRAARRAGTPHVVNPAGALPIDGRSTILKRVFNALVGSSLIRNAAGHVAITAAERPQFGDYGVPLERVTVIPNGVEPTEFAQHDVANFRLRHELGDAPLVLFMGRLNPIKGPDLLLDAFSRLSAGLAHYRLVFAGPDEGMEDAMRVFAAAHGLTNRVQFVGTLSGTQKAAAYHAADLLVVPSRREAMSIVALEGGACGKPALITDQCGFDELEDFGGGRVVAASAPALASVLDELLSQPPLMRAMGQKLEAQVRSRYTWKAAALRYRDLFASVTT